MERVIWQPVLLSCRPIMYLLKIKTFLNRVKPRIVSVKDSRPGQRRNGGIRPAHDILTQIIKAVV